MVKILAVLLLVLGLVLPAAAQSGGRFYIEEDTHDFGRVEEGEHVTHVFTFVNTGEAPLSITAVTPACGCTTPTWTDAPVAPGARGEITAVFNSIGRPGSFRKSIEVHTDGRPARKLLFLEGDVVPPTLDADEAVAQGGLLFETDTFTFGPTASDAGSDHAFVFQNTGARPVKIRRVRVYPDGALGTEISVRYSSKPIFAGELGEVGIDVKPAAPEAFDYAIVLETDDLAHPVKSLRVRRVTSDGE